jgi:hypothetical protein
VTNFHLDDHQKQLTIDYNDNQHATYQLRDMQDGTTFQIVHGTDPLGHEFSQLGVVEASTEEHTHLIGVSAAPSDLILV